MKLKTITGIFFLVLSLISQAIYPQVIVLEKIDLKSGTSDQSIQLEYSPSTLDLTNLFDEQDYSFVGGQTDSITIKLTFAEPKELKSSRAFFVLFPGQYSLEAASTVEDFNAKSGSYQRIVSSKAYSSNKVDSVEIPLASTKVIQLIVKNPATKMAYIGEWSLYLGNEIVSLLIMPYPPRLIPGTNLTLEAAMLDAKGNTYPYPDSDQLMWRSGNQSVASFNDENPVLTGNALGTSEITVQTASGDLKGTATASVETDFKPELAETKTVKVAVVYQDPVISMGQRMHVRYNWEDPRYYITEIVKEFEKASDGVYQFEIVEVHDDQVIFSKLDTTYLTVGQIKTYLDEPGWVTVKNLAEKQGRIKFDYKGMIEYYDFYNKREQGIIDEVWVYSWPFGGMYESQLVGKNAFWWNSSPITDVPENFTKLLSVMGWNYERGVAEAMHSVGHRAESALRVAFGRWDNTSEDPNPWELFTTIDRVKPGKGNVGNIHFPFNAAVDPNPNDDTDPGDYDYDNTRVLTTYAKNWLRYPYLLDQTETGNCSLWGTGHLGYMKYWFHHLPHAKGKTNGILNDWWHYFIDYEGAVALAQSTPTVGVEDIKEPQLPEDFKLEQNYPNPFNPTTTISFQIPESEHVTLKIYDVLGREVRTLVNEVKSPGYYTVNLDATVSSGMSSGVYFYRLKSGAFTQTKKLMLIK